ncbi:MAG: hypothetical protein Q4D17_01715 [Planctomycetia bacterium]|nr:hypothetical protein [Planctomycetia bacterium]
MGRKHLRVTRNLLWGIIIGLSFLAESVLCAQMIPANGVELSNEVPSGFSEVTSQNEVSSRNIERGTSALHPAERSRTADSLPFENVSVNSRFSTAYSANSEEKKLFSASESSTVSDSGKANEGNEKKSKFSFSAGVKKLAFSVAVVTLLFFVLLLILKKFSPKDAPELPKEAFEILGKSHLAFRHQLYLMRCGEKIFIVSISQNGVDRIGEIEDPAEAERLARLCRGEILGTNNLRNFEEYRSRVSGEKAAENVCVK